MNKIKSFWAWLMASKKRWIVALVIVAVAIFSIWKISSAQGNKLQYQTSTVQKGTVVSTISASGKALTTNILAIDTQASGVVKKVYVKDGDKVLAGQKIAEIT